MNKEFKKWAFGLMIGLVMFFGVTAMIKNTQLNDCSHIRETFNVNQDAKCGTISSEYAFVAKKDGSSYMLRKNDLVIIFQENNGLYLVAWFFSDDHMPIYGWVNSKDISIE